MALLTSEEKDQIAAAVADAESRTSGEIVVVVARRSDPYRFIPTLWAAFFALLVPAPLILLSADLTPSLIYMTQLGSFFVLFGLLFIDRVRMALVPRAIKYRRAGRHARAQFLECGLHRTESRTGVLIFASLAEHYVEILADAGISSKVPQQTWDAMVAKFIAAMRVHRPATAFMEIVAAVGTELQRSFPKSPGDRNELPNRLIEVDD